MKKQFKINIEVLVDRKDHWEEFALRFEALPICQKVLQMAGKGKASIKYKMSEVTVGKQRASRNKRKKSK